MLSDLPIFLRAYVFALVALSCAALYLFFLLPKYKANLRILLLWGAITSAAFLIHNYWILLAVVWIIFALAVPRSGGSRIAYYFAVLPALPIAAYQIPGFAGLSQLFTINYPRALALFVLLPLLVRTLLLRNRLRLFSGWTDVVVIAYVAWQSALEFRDPSFTNGIRGILQSGVLDILIPYLAISRVVNSISDLKKVLAAVLVSAILVAWIGVIEQTYRWWFYGIVTDLMSSVAPDGFSRGTLTRWGLIRVRTSMKGGAGYLMVVGSAFLLCSYCINGRKVFTLCTLALFLLTAMFTGARGSQLALVLTIVFFVIYNLAAHPKHKLLLAACTVATSTALLLLNPVPSTEEFLEMDKSGTFEYRLELIEYSVPFILDHPVTGVAGMSELEATGQLEPLRQGQGIIDIVNTYIQVAIFSGIPGLTLFVLAFAVPTVQLHRLKGVIASGKHREYFYIRNALLALLLSTALLIFTTSSINYVPVYYWSIIALSSAFVRILRVEKKPLRVRAFVPTARTREV